MMEAHLYALHDCIWMVLEDGPLKIQMENPERNPATPDVIQYIPKPKEKWDDRDCKKHNLDNVAKAAIFKTLDPITFSKIKHLKAAMEIWQGLGKLCEGSEDLRKQKIEVLLEKFKGFKMLPGESFDMLDERFHKILNDLASLNHVLSPKEKNVRLLRSLPTEWYTKATAMEEGRNLENYTVQGLLDELRTYEHELKKKKEEQVTPFPTALMTTSRIPSNNHFTTWDQLHGEFLKRFFPPSKTTKIRRMIQNFKQNPNEPLYEAWERFKDLQRQCPHHNIQSWHLMTTFCEGLNENSRILFDASAGGSFMSLELDEAEELIERISTNGSTWYSHRPSAQPKIGGMYEVDQMSAMAAKVDSMMSMIQKIAQVSAVQNTTPAPPPVPVLLCVSCGGQHDQSSCPWDAMEQVDNVNYYQPQQQQSPFGGFNSQNRNHPGFSWSNPSGAANPQAYRSSPPGFQNQQQQQFRGVQGFANNQQFKQNQSFPYVSNQQKPILPTPETTSVPGLDNIVDQLLKSQLAQAETLKQITQELTQLRAHNRMLENQISNQASTSSTKVTGKLPACAENPREQMNAVTIWSGKQFQSPLILSSDPDDEIREDAKEEPQNKVKGDAAEMLQESIQIKEGNKKEDEGLIRKYASPIPFPNRLKKSHVEERRSKFLNLIKQLDISIPLLDAITEIPSYAKFLKEILTKKKENPLMVAMNQDADLKEISKSVHKTLEIISLLSETVSNTMEIYASDSQLQLKEINKVKEQIASVTVSLQKQMSLLQMDIRSALAVASANQVVTKDYLKVIIDNQKEAYKLFRLIGANSGNRKMEHGSGLDGIEFIGTIVDHFSNDAQSEERRENLRRIKELCGNMKGISEVAGSSKRKRN
ncbi:unnamed protein product [Cuscuta campestris]|uniref:Retrotransposon gag domain-containing protein n=1 Tax=Cuscuta campestris TaxID=132261 RepID=A0A484M3D8_9ASTE|nr:unnamed protein product [Cuscuta campestris]